MMGCDSLDDLPACPIDAYFHLVDETLDDEVKTLLSSIDNDIRPAALTALIASIRTKRTRARASPVSCTACTERISIRLPHGLLKAIRAQADAESIPYQRLMKSMLSKAVK